MYTAQRINQGPDQDYYTVILTLFIVAYIGLNSNCILNGNQETKKEAENLNETAKQEDVNQELNMDEEIGVYSNIIDEEINKILLEVNERINWRLVQHAADKTGQADFASERAGGAIVRVENASTYMKPPKMGFISVSKTHGPEYILQSSHMPGDCWAFKGSTASVVIELSYYIYITSVTIEHISKTISPSGNISSAPKDFSIWGFESPHSENNFLLGKYTYKIDGKPLQQFIVETSTRKSLKYIKMNIHSNHGNPEYTCVYRLRVHGNPL